MVRQVNITEEPKKETVTVTQIIIKMESSPGRLFVCVCECEYDNKRGLTYHSVFSFTSIIFTGTSCSYNIVKSHNIDD